MTDPNLPLVPASTPSRPLHVVRPDEAEAFLAGLSPSEAALLRDCDFSGKSGDLVLLPGAQGIGAAVAGLGDDRSPFAFGDLPRVLPAGTWRLASSNVDKDVAALGWCLGAYAYAAFKQPKRAAAQLAAEPGLQARAQAAAIWLARDLINTPANLLGPAELADAAIALAARYGASPVRVTFEALARAYPAVQAVGAGSDRPPVVAGFSWSGSRASESAPLIALCGKGVCFDTGGYDLKPADGMLRMKKDMGGAAVVLGLASAIMACDLPVRLLVRIGCVENSVSGRAMRPLDVIETRRGLCVEIGNTDAEGRLVLADLLAEACEFNPTLLIDCATLTGAARVALGPDIPALFSNDQAVADRLLVAARDVHDPMWRLPLWDGYDGWLDSAIADLNNVSSKPFAGAVVAALFLRRFVRPGVPWLHLDLYAWNDSSRPGRPEGGEAPALRAMFSNLCNELSL
jgi:leucyl aminopeptidase